MVGRQKISKKKYRGEGFFWFAENWMKVDGKAEMGIEGSLVFVEKRDVGCMFDEEEKRKGVTLILE